MNVFKLTSWDHAFQALCSNPDFRQNLYDEAEVIMKDVLLTLHGDKHRQRRCAELRLFRRIDSLHYETEIFPKMLTSA